MNPNLPVGGSALDLQLGSHGALPADVTQLALTQSYSRFGTEYDGSDAFDGDAPKLDVWLTQLLARHHFGEGWAMDLTVPAGTIVVEGTRGEHSRRLSGFGDLEVGGSYDFAALWGAGGYRPSLTLRLGLALPTGRAGTVGEEGGAVPPNVLSIGNGAYGGAAEVRLTQFVGRRVALAPYASVRSPFGRNESGTDMGASTSLGLDALVLPASWFFVAGGGSLHSRSQSDEQHEGRILNSGGQTIAASLSVGFVPSKRVSLGVGGRLPVCRHVNGRQIAESYTVLGTLGLSFGGSEEDEHAHGSESESEHGHELEHGAKAPHGELELEEQDAAQLDFADEAQAGQSFDLGTALSPGKVTVIDFWAEWCHPCKHIEATLRRLARENPGLAVRRVEVPDFDSPVAKQHLAGETSLPLLWLYDASGKRRQVLRRPEDVEPAVRELLEK